MKLIRTTIRAGAVAVCCIAIPQASFGTLAPLPVNTPTGTLNISGNSDSVTGTLLATVDSGSVAGINSIDMNLAWTADLVSQVYQVAGGDLTFVYTLTETPAAGQFGANVTRASFNGFFGAYPVSVGNLAAGGVGSAPFSANALAAFADSSLTGNTIGFNLGNATAGNPPGTGTSVFQMVIATSGTVWEPSSATLSDGATADTVSLAVPEPTTMVAGALLLLPFGMSTVRALRRNSAV